MDVGDLLKQTPLFENLSAGEIDILAQSTRIQTYRTGQVILREGRVGAAFFILVSGSVEVVKGQSGSEPVVLATLEPANSSVRLPPCNMYLDRRACGLDKRRRAW